MDDAHIDLSEGWFPVWRKIDDSWVWKDPVVLKVWLECMRVAAHSHRWFDLRVGTGVVQVELQIGQCVFGRRAWGKKLRLEPKKVERIIIALVKHGNLGREVTHHYSVLTLLQYGVYRYSKTESDPIVDPTVTQPCPNCDPTLSLYKKVKTVETFETVEKQEEALSVTTDPPPPNSGIQDLIMKWNQIDGIVHCRKATDPRKRAYRTRSCDQDWLDSIDEALAKIAASDFCRGENDRGWRVDIDWFLKPDSLTKAIEGKYDQAEEGLF